MPDEAPGPGSFKEDKYKAFMARMEMLSKRYAENTAETRKLIRILKANGFQDPAEVARVAPSALRPLQPPIGNPFHAMANHLMQAFTPEDIRDMTEELFDEFIRTSRRRRR